MRQERNEVIVYGGRGQLVDRLTDEEISCTALLKIN